MKIKVPSDRLPNSQAYQAVIKTAQEKLTKITVAQLIESGLVNTSYGRGLQYHEPSAIEESSHHLITLIARYLEQKYPYLNLVKEGVVKNSSIVRGGSTGLGVGIQLIFKDKDKALMGLFRGGERDILSPEQCTSSEVRVYGSPKWLNRYVAHINRLCVLNKIPGMVSVVVTQYSPVLSPFGASSFSPSDEYPGLIRVTLMFDPVTLIKPGDEYLDSVSGSYVKSYGKLGRSRSPHSSLIGYLCEARSLHELTSGRLVEDRISFPPHALAFFAKHITQIVKTLHRKAEYVPSVFAVKV